MDLQVFSLCRSRYWPTKWDPNNMQYKSTKQKPGKQAANKWQAKSMQMPGQ